MMVQSDTTNDRLMLSVEIINFTLIIVSSSLFNRRSNGQAQGPRTRHKAGTSVLRFF